MFGLGFTEIFIILIVVIIFIKPEDLPKIIQRIGSTYRKYLRMYYAVTDEIQDMTSLESTKKTWEAPEHQVSQSKEKKTLPCS